MFRSVASVIFASALAFSAQGQERTVSGAPATAVPKTASAPGPSPVCFSVTQHCFAPKVATAEPSRLDLRAPAIAAVVPASELEGVLPDPDEPKYDEEFLVKVKGDRDFPVDIPVGIMALPWAVRNPTQAWRIFLPTPSRLKSDDDD